jgi:hypothetical protein
VRTVRCAIPAGLSPVLREKECTRPLQERGTFEAESRQPVPMLWTSRVREAGERLLRSIVARVGSNIPMPSLRPMAARGSRSYRELA